MLVQYCLDGQDIETLKEAAACQYGNYGDLSLKMRYASTRWAKVTAQTVDRPGLLTIHVAPHLLQEVEIYDGQTGAGLAGPIGTQYPYSSEHGLLAGYTFAFDLDTAGQHTFYVRMVTYGLPYSFVEASLDPVTAQEQNQQIGLGIHLGVLGLLTLISTTVYIATRSRIMGVFALNILSLLLSILLGSGLMYVYLWPNSPGFNEWLFTTLFYLKPALWVLLAQTFLLPYQTPNWYRPACNIAYVVVLLMLGLSWLGHKEISNWLMLVFGVTLIPLMQLVAIRETSDIRALYRRILMLGYGLGALVMWIGLLITLYPSDNPRLPIQLSRLVDYVNPIVLLALVMFHYRETVTQLAVAEEENLTMRLGLEFEQRLREERKLMIDMLTHELKNPLASISMAMGSLSNAFKDSDSPVKRRLKNIDQSVRSMDLVLERCNLMNQLDHSALPFSPETVNLRNVMSNIIERFAEGDRVSLHFSGSDTFATDPQFFQMMVSNLIENALKYSAPNSEIKVSMTQSATNETSRLVIEVKNQIGSHGFPDKAQVFARFYRHPSARDKAGSGVGLYLVKALTKLLNGRITYEHDTEHVVFRIELPETTSDA
ncbi:sensor histidine kinase [Orrella daihaiensis]|uniref:histidine kinase n=1 Tax=Orrella daihaiensis TaxID=2782176 RepID=A0ABY4AJB9_9BURK|nr:sensor histidine kinase [Orrella daihaiensis]UOD50384.1 GHKL domain-containing protein [Orrella daihaiensis]